MLNENNIGFKIKTIREQKGLSQSEVVNKLKEKNIIMSRETLSKIENNNRSISAIELNALCKVLNVEIETIFNEDGEDDLVTLFRKKGNFDDETIKEIEELQEMIKIFINHERIFKGKFQPQKRIPLWEECLN